MNLKKKLKKKVMINVYINEAVHLSYYTITTNYITT